MSFTSFIPILNVKILVTLLGVPEAKGRTPMKEIGKLTKISQNTRVASVCYGTTGSIKYRIMLSSFMLRA